MYYNAQICFLKYILVIIMFLYIVSPETLVTLSHVFKKIFLKRVHRFHKTAKGGMWQIIG